MEILRGRQFDLVEERGGGGVDWLKLTKKKKICAIEPVKQKKFARQKVIERMYGKTIKIALTEP